MNDYILTEEGRKYMKKGLPEKNLIELLETGSVKIGDANRKVENFHIALQWAKKNGWVKISGEDIILIRKPSSIAEQSALEKTEKGEDVNSDIISALLQRKLIEKKGSVTVFDEKEITVLTPDLIKTKAWKNLKIRPYNVEVAGKKLYPGKKHVLSYYIEKIRKIFFDFGFQEAEGPLIESSFWNFDALYQPQDHPARDLADTFYMKRPSAARLPDRETIREVKEAHEHGGITGSTGWGYKWNEDVAKQPILRTHTTAVSARMLKKIELPAKVFCIGRVFRNETIDYKHLPEFTQIEGIVADENVGFRDLLGYLKEFYLRMGFKKIRFRPAYFPYTEMAVEPEVYFEERGEWLELGGSGIFRPEVTKPLGIDCPVLAWGLGLERPIMLKLALNDIRNFYYKNDMALMRDFKMVM